MHSSEASVKRRLALGRALALPSLLLLLGTGCNSGDAAEQAEATPPPKPFEGKVDSRLVGHWATKDARMSFELNQDGTSRVKSRMETGRGPSVIDVKGQWLVNEKELLFKNEGSQGIERYLWALKNPRTLEISRTFPKTKYLYFKK